MEKIFLSYSVAGVVSLDSSGNVKGSITNLMDFDSLQLSELENLEIVTDSSIVHKFCISKDLNCKIDLNQPILREWRTQRLSLLKSKLGLNLSEVEFHQKIRQQALDETRTIIKQTSSKRDELSSQIIHAIDDLQKSLNLTSNRLSELYSLYFPELVSNIQNPLTLAKIVVSLDKRSDLDKTILEQFNLPKIKIEYILNARENTLGGDFDEIDLKPIKFYANSLLNLGEQIFQLEKWIEDEMIKIGPNLSAVAGPNVAARLIASVGSLRALAMKSSSKIQTIGAEKALYAALRGRGSPPKHGIIFQIPEIGNSPYWIRGKLARAYSNKIAIAARLDEFNGEYLGENYREDLRKLEKELRQQFPKAPPRKTSNIRTHTHPAKQRIKRRKK